MMKPSDDRGAAAVEFALIVPLLLLLVLGIAEFGRAYNIQTTISGAAREGARAMALQNDPAAARATAQAAAGGLRLTTSQIVVTPTACPTSSTATATLATVTINYPMSFISGLFGTTITLHGTGVMRCNG